jgi:hypothetical protein
LIAANGERADGIQTIKTTGVLWVMTIRIAIW